jgi:predicted DNA-binding transcriptional regulator AlpA
MSDLDIMGFREVREALGISATRMHQLRERDSFPKPVAQLAATPVWDGPQVRAFAEARRQRAMHELQSRWQRSVEESMPAG